MAKPWRLVPVAELSLREIGRWTSETFGPQQAATYREKLIDACRQIAEGTAKSRVCRTYFDQGLSKDFAFRAMRPAFHCLH